MFGDNYTDIEIAKVSNMKKLAIIFTLLGILTATTYAYTPNSPEAVSLTLAQALDMSLKNSPAVIQAQGQLDTAKNKIAVVSANDNPTIGIALSATPWKNGSDTPTNNPLYTNSIAANYPLFTGFGNSSSISATECAYNAARYSLDDAVRQARVTTALYYLDCLNAIGDVKANRENVRNLQAHDDFVRVQYNVGKVSKLTLLQSTNELSQAKLKLIQAENILTKTFTQFKIQIGMPDSTQLKLNAEDKALDTPTQEVALAGYQSSRPDVLAQKAVIESDEYSVRAANAGWWPTVGLNATAGTNDQNLIYSDTGKYSWSVGATLNYALTDGGATTSAVKAAAIQLNNDNKQLNIISAQALADIKQNYSNLRDAEQALVVAQDGLSFAQEAYDISKESFELGKSDNLTYFDAQKKLLDAKVNYNKAFYSVIQASYGVVGAIG